MVNLTKAHICIMTILLLAVRIFLKKLTEIVGDVKKIQEQQINIRHLKNSCEMIDGGTGTCLQAKEAGGTKDKNVIDVIKAAKLVGLCRNKKDYEVLKYIANKQFK